MLSAAAINIAEHQFQVAIQAAIDIGQQILADLNLPPPKDYADIFAQLGETGVLPADFAQRLIPMVRFRNILVHLYLEVDLHRVYHYLQHNLGDLEMFVKHITSYIQARSAREGGIA